MVINSPKIFLQQKQCLFGKIGRFFVCHLLTRFNTPNFFCPFCDYTAVKKRRLKKYKKNYLISFRLTIITPATTIRALSTVIGETGK